MYTKSSILTAASGLVGWKYSTDSNYAGLANKTSSSGYYVNDLPGITVGLLAYAGSETSVCDYVNSIHNSETLKIIDAVIAKKKDLAMTKELLSNNTLIQSYNDLDLEITRSGRFVGFCITPRESKSIVSRIQQIGFLSSAAQSFTLYLFDTSQKTAIQTKTITITTADSVEWTTLDWDISFDRDAGSAGQSYLIGYFEDDLSSNLYEDDWTGQCAHVAQRIFGHYMGVYPIRMNSGVLDGVSLPNIKYLRSSNHCRTPGFNLRFNTKCDITKVLTDNIDMFAQAVQYAVAVRILGDVLKSNLDLNVISNARDKREDYKDLITEYNGKLYGGVLENGNYVPGIIDRVNIDFSNLDAVCFKRKPNEILGARWQ
jgi:hypothetical protein